MRHFIKFWFDRIFALLGLIVASPLLVILSLVLFISDRSGPVFYTQKRVGKDGRLFTLVKFRTMRPNPGTNTVTARNDNRITPVGAFLRRWKLDELPELFNVLAGDMSFVGPRPDVPGYADCLQGDARRVLRLRPGITGPATLKYIDEEEILAGVENPVEYNDRVIFPDKVRINLRYLEKMSLAGDLRMIYYTLIRKKLDEY